jgi:hypothetical protein
MTQDRMVQLHTGRQKRTGKKSKWKEFLKIDEDVDFCSSACIKWK